MEHVTKNCSINKGTQIRKHFKNIVTVTLHYIEAQVK